MGPEIASPQNDSPRQMISPRDSDDGDSIMLLSEEKKVQLLRTVNGEY